MFVRVFGGTVLSFLFAASGAQGSSLYTAVGATVSGVIGNPALNSCNVSNANGSPVRVDGCTVFAAANPLFSGPEYYSIAGTASATYNSLGVSNFIQLQNAALVDGNLDSSSYARIIDRLTTSLPSNDMISFVFNLDGLSIPPFALDTSAAVVSFGFNYGNAFPYAWQFGTANFHSTFHGQVVTPAYPVSFFQNYSYFVSLSAQNLVTARTSQSYTALGSLQFDSPPSFGGLNIASVGVWDQNGNLVRNAVVGNSGAGSLPVLNVAEVSGIPEPSTWLLSGAGLLLIALRRRCVRLRFLNRNAL